MKDRKFFSNHPFIIEQISLPLHSLLKKISMQVQFLFRKISFIAVLLFAFVFVMKAEEPVAENHEAEAKEEGFNPGKMIMHHIQDANEWHFFTWKKADGSEFEASIPLPMILYSKENGLDIFLSNKFHNPGHSYKGYVMEHNHVVREDGISFYNISITKNVTSMLIGVSLMLWIFIGIGNRYKNNANEAPKGIQSLLEPIILFVRDEIAKPLLGEHKYEKFMPYLLTVFFFIWINNMLGLFPSGANFTGNITVTMSLALCTFLITILMSKKGYWKHIFVPDGVPRWLVIMPLVEFLGVFTKPFALMIRLFANITAGHMIVLSICSLIFIFAQKSIFAGIGVSVVSVAFMLFVYFLELLVAFIQAYIFTTLSSLFIGEAIADPHHKEEH